MNDWSPDRRYASYISPEQSQDRRRYFIYASYPETGNRSHFCRPLPRNEQASFRLMVIGSRPSRTNRVRMRFTYGHFRDRVSSQAATSGGISARWRRDGKELYTLPRTAR